MTDTVNLYTIISIALTLMLIDGYIDLKIDAIKRKPIFSPIQMNQFYEGMLTSSLVAYRNGRAWGISRSKLEQVAKMIIRAQKELQK